MHGCHWQQEVHCCYMHSKQFVQAVEMLQLKCCTMVSHCCETHAFITLSMRCWIDLLIPAYSNHLYHQKMHAPIWTHCLIFCIIIHVHINHQSFSYGTGPQISRGEGRKFFPFPPPSPLTYEPIIVMRWWRIKVQRILLVCGIV